METLQNLLTQPENQEIWHKNGEHSRTSQDSIKIHLDISIGNFNHFTIKTELDSCGYFLSSIFINLSYSMSWLKTVFTANLINLNIEKERMIEHWRYRLGEVNKSHSAPHRDRRFPVDRKKNYVRYSNFHQVKRNKRISMIWTNWWCRD